MTSLYEKFCKRKVSTTSVDSRDYQTNSLSETSNQELSRDDYALLSGKTAYRIWSELLQANIWLAANDEAKARLQEQGVTETIYTLIEAEKLLSLPIQQRLYIHTWKAGLSGTIDSVKRIQD